MLAFVYDNTFEGVLSAVFDAYTTNRFPDTLLLETETAPLTVSETHVVRTSPDNAKRVFAGLSKRLSREGKNMLLLAFLSEEKDVGALLFRFMRKILDESAKEGDFSDADMSAVDKLARKVYAEHHLMLGFARFQKTADGIYFAALAPKYNILALMTPHLADRFANHPWIVYDAVRGFGLLHKGGEIHDIILDPALLRDGSLPPSFLDAKENALQDMWRGYFQATGIPERTNPKLQARCMPRRYWRFMTEMQPQRNR